jgi:hypothetical protein
MLFCRDGASRNDDEALTLFFTHQLIYPSRQCAADVFARDVGQITATFSRVFCPHEGRFAIVTKRWPEDAVDAGKRKRRMRLSRTAKSWRPDTPMLVSSS